MPDLLGFRKDFNLSDKKPFGAIPNGFVFSFTMQAASGS